MKQLHNIFNLPRENIFWEIRQAVQMRSCLATSAFILEPQFQPQNWGKLWVTLLSQKILIEILRTFPHLCLYFQAWRPLMGVQL